jgi:Domain of unknown function (DUF4274)
MPMSPPDWSQYWVEEDADGNEPDAVQIMIDWLAGQKPAAWHKFAADYMNWDRSVDIGVWILNRPECDRATAACLLFGADPVWQLDAFRKGHIGKISNEILLTALSNWNAGFYRSCAIGHDLGDAAQLLSSYRAANGRYDGRVPPFTVPKEFFGPFTGTAGTFPEADDPYVNPQMWALINALAVQLPSKASDQWRQDTEAAERLWKKEREQADLFTRMLWHPPLVVPYGPEFETNQERDRYLQGDNEISQLLFRRAKTALRKAARG